jgi:DNA-binding response OmpR family regulator
MTAPETRFLVPGRFSSAAINIGNGELEVRLSDGGNWQVKVRRVEEDEWRLLCRGHLDGSIFEAGLTGHLEPITVGPLTVDPARRRVDVNGTEASLTAGEFDLVALLATEAERVFTKPELLRALWGVADRSKVRALDSRASRIRCKLRDAGADGFVVNYRERGYMLCEGDAASNGGPQR